MASITCIVFHNALHYYAFHIYLKSIEDNAEHSYLLVPITYVDRETGEKIINGPVGISPQTGSNPQLIVVK
jgi:hypothetical protein